MNKAQYITEGHRLLSNTQFYKLINTELTGGINQRVNLHAQYMLQRGQISQKNIDICAQISMIQTKFYMLPKIHKNTQNPPGRSTVSGNGDPSEKISKFVDHSTGTLIPLSKSCIEDSNHLVNILQELSVPPGVFLCILNFTSLYTNIPPQ